MPRLTEHLVLPPGGERRPPVPIKNDVEDLGDVVDPTREQKVHATTVVLNRLGHDGAARTVLAALFQPPRKRPPWEHKLGPAASDPAARERAVASQAAAAFGAFERREADPGVASAPADPRPVRESAPYIGDNAAARALRTDIRVWGRANGWIINNRGSLKPRLIEAYYAAHPEATR